LSQKYYKDIVDETDIRITHDGDFDCGCVYHTDLIWLSNFLLRHIECYTDENINLVYNQLISVHVSDGYKTVPVPSKFSDRDSHCKIEVKKMENLICHKQYFRLKFIFPRPQDGRNFFDSL
jgi:hypothetical protein